MAEMAMIKVDVSDVQEWLDENDVVCVTRCKDCIHSHEHSDEIMLKCSITRLWVSANHYCGYAKENEKVEVNE